MLSNVTTMRNNDMLRMESNAGITQDFNLEVSGSDELKLVELLIV